MNDFQPSPAFLPWSFLRQAQRSNASTSMQAAMQYAFAMFATTSKANYKELTVLSTAHRLSLPPALRMLVDKYRCVALSDRPGSHIALDCMNEKINMAIADATRGKLRLGNCDSLVGPA